MAHDLIKFGLALAALVVTAVVVAALVSGYLTAYKPASKITTPASSGISARSARVTPVPTPTMPAGAYARYPQNPPVYPPPVPEMPVSMEPGLAPASGMPAQMPSATPVPSQTAIPPSPQMTFWYYIFQDLLRVFPGLFSGLQRAFPQWPVGWFGGV
ncbi:MAG TPA: hypothetical protein VMC84_10480 [Methanocella sp.]|uniref:hypothetical protein n=1 Tax=Methanocella sp. TaxID=2052833 RepID=UPI002D086CFC|nr:hypothetical protein [Methanocella sp.]HTY91591.1 hypothetical protein [Methanocella sp.]